MSNLLDHRGVPTLREISAASVPTPPSGQEYYFLDLDNLDNAGRGTPSTKNSAGTVRVRDDLELIAGVLRPTNNENLETGTALTIYTAQGDDVTGDFTNAGSGIYHDGTAWQNGYLPDTSTADLLLHMDDTGLSDSGADSLPTTAVGSAVRSTTVGRFNNKSLELDGVGDYLSVSSSANCQFGTGDFTIEGFFRRRGAGGGDEGLIGQFNGTASSFGWRATSGNIDFFVSGAGNTRIAYTLTNDVWTHLAITRSGTTWRVFVDGVSQALTLDTIGGASVGIVAPLMIGKYSTTVASEFNGFIDEVRVLKGTAAYTSNFTAPTAPFDSTQATTDNTVDTDTFSAAEISYVTGTTVVKDELDVEITGSGNINLAYYDGTSWSSLVDLETFKTLGTLIHPNFAIRVQAVGAQQFSEVEIQSPSSKLVLDKNADVITYINDIEAHRLSSKENRIKPHTEVDAATYDLLETDERLMVTYTATGAVTITIPTAQIVDGREFVIMDAGYNATTNNITIETEGSEKINNSTSDYVIDTDGDSATLYCDGTDLHII